MRADSRFLVILGAFGAAFLGLVSVTSPAYHRVGGLPFALATSGACVVGGALLAVTHDSRPRFWGAVTVLAGLSLAGLVVGVADPWHGASNRSWAWMGMVVVLHGAAALGVVAVAGRHWLALRGAPQREPTGAPATTLPMTVERLRSPAQRLEAVALAVGTLPAVTGVLWVASLLLLVGDGGWVGLGLGILAALPAWLILGGALGDVFPWLVASPSGNMANTRQGRASKVVRVAAAVSLVLGGIPVRGMDFETVAGSPSGPDVWAVLVVLLEAARVSAGLGLLLLLRRWSASRRSR